MAVQTGQARGRAWKRLRTGAQAVACLSLLVASLPGHALEPDKRFQDYVRNNWSIEQGLPQLSVTALAQDSTGYVWMGTQAGLARFDGNRFITLDGHDWTGLGSGDIRALMAGRDGCLWVGTAQGVARYAHGRFQELQPQPAVSGPFEVNALARDRQGHVLVGSSQGVFMVDGDHLTALPRPQSAATTALLQEDDGLWIGGIGLVRRVPSQGSDTLLPLPAAASSAAVRVLARAHGRLWAGSSAGLYVGNGKDWTRYDDPLLGHAPVDAMLHDGDDNLWVAASGHLFRLRGGKVVERVGDDPQLAARALMEDREHNLWLGTLIAGATRVWNGGTRRYSIGDGLADPLLWTVARGIDGQIWVGSNNGVSVFDHGHFSNVVSGRQLPHPAAYSMLVDRREAWIGTRAGVALLRDGQVQRPALLSPMDGAQINGILRDHAGRLWFATSNGLFRLVDGVLTRYGVEQGLADPRVRILRETHDGRLLVGSYSGLYEWRDERLFVVGTDRGFPPDLHITAIHELADGRLLVGNLSRASMLLYDHGRWIELGEDRGIPSNPILAMASDPGGQLWVAGLRGVYRLPLADLDHVAASHGTTVHAQNLLNERGDRHGGQKGDCCNGAGNGRGFLQDGAFWLPTRDGLVALDTETDHGNPVPPTPLVERVQVQGRWRDVEAGGSWDLPAQARDLRFEFTALSFQAPQHIDIRYRLRGYDPKWMTLENIEQRSVNYTNLPPGHYVFEVLGVNNSGLESPAPAALAFRIQPYFYEQWWFRTAAALAVLGVLLLVYGWLSRRHARQRAVLESLVQARTRDLRDANSRLEALSVTDPLTGLHNRRYLGRQIPLDLAFYERDAGMDIEHDALVFGLLDVDHFKRINDTHGHEAGDRVLQQLADCLRGLARKGDYVVRWGGEEFLLVFRPMPRGQLPALGERICAAIAGHPFDIGHDTTLPVTASLGLMEYPPFPTAPHLLGWEQMVALADRALYTVKRGGRNGWAAYRPVAGAQVSEGAFDGRLDNLLEHGWLRLAGSGIASP